MSDLSSVCLILHKFRSEVAQTLKKNSVLMRSLSIGRMQSTRRLPTRSPHSAFERSDWTQEELAKRGFKPNKEYEAHPISEADSTSS